MTLQLFLASLNVVLVWFSIYMYARTKGKQEQYKKVRNSFLNSKIDTICDKLVELEKKYGEILKERSCVQLDKDTLETLKHIDLNTTAISIMVTESKIKECEEKEDFEKAEEFKGLLEADKNYLFKKMMQEARTNDNLARKFFDKLKEMARKYDKDNVESND